jgi:signal transduction histidine kinase
MRQIVEHLYDPDYQAKPNESRTGAPFDCAAARAPATLKPGMDVVARLLEHRTLGGAPRAELEWLAAHGESQHVDRGNLNPVAGEPHPLVRTGLESLMILFAGCVVMYGDHGAGRHKLMEWRSGDVTGYLPYSRMSGPAAGELVAAEPIDLLAVNRIHFPEMILACPWVTTTLVHVMVDRARHFRASELYDEKMKSLGKLAAGLAHELNNPASASARSAHLLSEALGQSDAAARTLRAAGLSDTQFALLDRVRDACVAGQIANLTALERADREDALAERLAAHGADPSAAAALVDSALSVQMLDQLAATIGSSQLQTAIRWLASRCTARALASDIERATMRISTLVGAVKRFAYMDRALTPEPVAIRESVDDTVVLLQEKIRQKSIGVEVDIAADVPPARAIGGDLNQVLMHVIDNALDASPQAAVVRVSAERAHDRVVVRIIDHGPGIPAAIRDRIFDPFITTKPVGQGTGLGLDIARQLVRRNDGDIEVDSVPGRTEFRIVLQVYAAARAELSEVPGISRTG